MGARPRVRRGWGRARAIAAGLALAACEVATPGLRLETGPDAQATPDGLVRVANARADLAFVKPGADLRGYSKILLDPVSIAYKRPPRGTRQDRSGEFGLSDEQMAQMKRYFQEAFEEELRASRVYALASEAADEVLRVRGHIVDLVVTVPPQPTGREEVFVASAGEMTLVLELSDSLSGEVLARVADRREARAAGGDVYQSTPVTNWSAVRRMFRHWASLLRERLDGVRELPELPGAPAAAGTG
jgi:hypothetical protein